MKIKTGLILGVLAGLTIGAASCGKMGAPGNSGQPMAQPVNLATAGTITGTVKLEGPAPKRWLINMKEDPVCAAAHPEGILDEEVIADASGNLANVIVYVKDGPGNRAFSAPEEPVTIDQRGCVYSPHVAALMVGQTLQVLNSDQTVHNVHPEAQKNAEWNKVQLAGGPPIEAKFDHEEVGILLRCDVHPWMKSYIGAFKHPYFQVTGPNGSFELKNLPPGAYTIEAWHEKYGTASQKAALGPKESKTVNLVFKARVAGS
jgi:plastocyanin